MKEDRSRWLINLPHAGGSINTFKNWNKRIKCNVLNIEYPGHWTRMREPLVDSFSELVDDVISNIESNVPKKSEVFLFGHSVGAIISWYISPILIRKGYFVKTLFLSGSQNPGSFPEKSILELSSDEDLLRLIGYCVEEQEATINEQFMKTFLPIIKKDLMVCKSFVCDGHFVDVKSVVLYGTNDVFTDVKQMQQWDKYVKLVSVCEFPGEHLFIEEKDNIDKIIEMINNIIKIEEGNYR